jgi:hypothetical protein
VAISDDEHRRFRLTEIDFVLTIDLAAIAPGATTRLTFTSSHSLVPDEVLRNGDRRLLAVRIYELRAEPIDRRKADTSSGGA